MVRSIGGMAFGRCLEVVRYSESPLLEVSLYIVYIDCSDNWWSVMCTCEVTFVYDMFSGWGG